MSKQGCGPRVQAVRGKTETAGTDVVDEGLKNPHWWVLYRNNMTIRAQN